MKMKSKYNKLILEENSKFEMAFKGSHKEFDFVTSKCDFCGHSISIGRSIKNTKTNEYMIVGCNCFCNLLEIDKVKAKIIKREYALAKNQNKYSKVKEYLKKEFDAKPWYEANKIRLEKIFWKVELRFKDDLIYFDYIEDEFKSAWDCNGVTHYTKNIDNYPIEKSRVNYLVTINQKKGYETADEILRKIDTTASPINKYWFEKFKQETKVDLKKLL